MVSNSQLFSPSYKTGEYVHRYQLIRMAAKQTERYETVQDFMKEDQSEET